MAAKSILIISSVTILLIAVVLALQCLSVSGAPEPVAGRGGGRGGGSRGSSSSRSRTSSSRGRIAGVKKSTLKKAALIGGGVYAGYKLNKLRKKFKPKGFGFDEWNEWREADGFLCRNNDDCSWLDNSMICQDYELNFEPHALWFGGDVASIRGECACVGDQFWDDDDLECRDVSWSLGIGLIIFVVVVVLIFMCLLCTVGFCVLRKVRNSLSK